MLSKIPLPDLQFWGDACLPSTLRSRPVFPVKPSQEHRGAGGQLSSKASLPSDVLVRFLEGSCSTSFIQVDRTSFAQSLA